MKKVRDGKKERYWRRVIRQQVESGETITRFCAREGVSPHQFHWWRRSLRARDLPSASGPQSSAGNEPAREDEEAGKSFLPVRLPFFTQAPIEMVHPRGWVVRVPVEFDPLSLRRILATLDTCSSDSGEN